MMIIAKEPHILVYWHPCLFKIAAFCSLACSYCVLHRADETHLYGSWSKGHYLSPALILPTYHQHPLLFAAFPKVQMRAILVGCQALECPCKHMVYFNRKFDIFITII